MKVVSLQKIGRVRELSCRHVRARGGLKEDFEVAVAMDLTRQVR